MVRNSMFSAVHYKLKGYTSSEPLLTDSAHHVLNGSKFYVFCSSLQVKRVHVKLTPFNLFTVLEIFGSCYKILEQSASLFYEDLLLRRNT